MKTLRSVDKEFLYVCFEFEAIWIVFSIFIQILKMGIVAISRALVRVFR